MSVTCTGLSALIQAATSQLGLLAETADAESDGSYLASVDGEYGSGASSEIATSPPLGPSRTAMIVPEHDHSNPKLSFPEHLMTLLMDPRNEDVVTFLPDGRYFAVRRKEFSDTLLYKHFHLTTFEEFLELIRGWGFARVNSNDNEEAVNGYSSGSIGCATNSSSSKAAIHVFRHPHFKRNHPVDMQKLRFGSKKHAHRAVDTARVVAAVPAVLADGVSAGHKAVSLEPGMVERNLSDDHSTNSSKRRLSPSHVARDTEDSVNQKEKRVGHTSNHNVAEQNGAQMDVTPPFIVATVSTSQDTWDPPLPRRSSIELRDAAQAIAATKLKLSCGEIEQDSDTNQGSETMRVDRNQCSRQQERRSSTASLVDGGVEAATHTIVTDAIETLLFDEIHTRETFKKHEKELSTSSIPGVVPISKQLFAGTQRGADAAASITHMAFPTLETSASALSPKQPTKSTLHVSTVVMNPCAEPANTFTSTYGTSEAVTWGNTTNHGHSHSNSIITHYSTPRKATTDSKERNGGHPATAPNPTSPNRLEAAAALVSQARQARDHAAKVASQRDSA